MNTLDQEPVISKNWKQHSILQINKTTQDVRCKKVLFLNLKAFSATGGIEKFNRAFLKALSDLEKEKIIIADSSSAYDSNADTNYLEAKKYKSYNCNRILFVWKVLRSASAYDTIILGHINLAFIGWGIKKIFPSIQIILITHGIEVWKTLSGFKKYILRNADKILAVSNFTKNTLAKVHKINPEKITVFQNTIDPLFAFPSVFKKPQYLVERYNLKPDEPIIFTLARLSATEKYKGYDRIINLLPLLKETFPRLKYILAGKSDEQEKIRLEKLKETIRIEKDVLLTGFIKDEEITDHYLLADVFIMPSRKEGFGIVFIEAMACGLAVIAGNKDGSADALKNGELGLLVDPEDNGEILNALKKCLGEKKDPGEADKKALQQKVIALFGFETFKQNLKEVLA